MGGCACVCVCVYEYVCVCAYVHMCVCIGGRVHRWTCASRNISCLSFSDSFKQELLCAQLCEKEY